MEKEKVCILNVKGTAATNDRKEAAKNLVQLLCALDDIDDSSEKRESNKEKGVYDDFVLAMF